MGFLIFPDYLDYLDYSFFKLLSTFFILRIFHRKKFPRFKMSATRGLVSYKHVSYKKKECSESVCMETCCFQLYSGNREIYIFW